MSDRNEHILAVYDDHMEEIYAFCLRRLRLPELAQDATSAVFHRFIDEYQAVKDKGEAGIRSWLYGAARNAVARRFRYDNRLARAQSDLARLAGDRDKLLNPSAEQLDWPVLHAAIGKLKRVYQDLVVLRYFQGLEISQIAEALGMKPVTVRVYLARAVHQLRSELEVSFGEQSSTT